LTTEQHFEIELSGRKLAIDTGKLAGQADGAVTVRYGDTIVLVTCTVSPEPREGIDFLPLTVDYEERLYAAGKIPGGFIRREGRPGQEATLAGRLTDRPIRPLLPKEWRREIQLIITVLSADQENDPDILAVIGGSAALSISSVPFAGPVATVRIGYLNEQMVINPTLAQLTESLFEVTVASTREAVIMLEVGAKEAPEEMIFQAIKLGHETNQRIIRLQDELQGAAGKAKDKIPHTEISPELAVVVDNFIVDKLKLALSQPTKEQRENSLYLLSHEVSDALAVSFPGKSKEVAYVLDSRIKAAIRGHILKESRRVSGRSLTEIRPLSCEVSLLPRTHGSALFNRGQTQVLTIATLGSLKKEQMLDNLGIEESKRFIHHYNFPPFSTGEVKRLGTVGRREIGHGALAERALEPVIPKEEEFPYTIRLVSEVMSSNGSTSMGSTCASSLCLMDAGIPIKRQVAGIAMGLVTGENGEFKILTDLEGIEDNYGDMDFKVAGTSEGVTAVQMDTKIKGLSFEIIEQTLKQAREARMVILDVMNKTLASPRKEMSRYAPRMYKISIDPDKIGSVIGAGGKTIRAIIEETKTSIDIENDGTVVIGATDEASARQAIGIIEGLTKEIEIGSIYTGKVTRITSFGAFVEILPGKEGMVHISEIANYRVARIEDEVKLGDEVTVKVIKNEEGKIGLSRKAVFDNNALAPGKAPEAKGGFAPREQGRRPEGHPPSRPPYPSDRNPHR
jgi:polyribonucleotide nucleotidyltransferase